MVKRTIIIAIVVLAALFMFVASLVVGINIQGGLPPSYSELAEIPVLGELIRIQEADEDAGEEGDSEEQEGRADADGSKGDASLFDMAVEERLEVMSEELEQKRKELNAKEKKLRRREREIEGWRKEFARSRERAFETLEEKEKELEQKEEELEAAREKFEEKTIELDRQKESNLEKTAGVFGRMKADQAAELLTEMYNERGPDNVVKIIYLMQDRNAAKIMDAMPDGDVGADIADRLSYVTRDEDEE